MSESRPTLLPSGPGLSAELAFEALCPSAVVGQGFVPTDGARLDFDAWSVDPLSIGGELRGRRHQADPQLVLIEVEPHALLSERPAPPESLAGMDLEPGEVLLDGRRGDAVLLVIDGELIEVSNAGGTIRGWACTSHDESPLDVAILMAPDPPSPDALYAELSVSEPVLNQARALATDAIGTLEAHGLILRTYANPDPTAAVEALLRGEHVASAATLIDGWLSTLEDHQVRVYALRAHARIDAWSEDLDQLEHVPVDAQVPNPLGDHLLIERDALESLRAVLSRRGERALGQRLHALEPALRDGPDVGFDPAIDRPWLHAVAAHDPHAWWTAPRFFEQ